jgi:hypothetical protein
MSVTAGKMWAQGSSDLLGRQWVRGSQGQPVAAPEVGELRQCRALLTSLLKALTLPDEEAVVGTGKMAWSTSTVGRVGALMGGPKRRNRSRDNDPEALALWTATIETLNATMAVGSARGHRKEVTPRSSV